MTQRNPGRASNAIGEVGRCLVRRSHSAKAGQTPRRRPRPLSALRVPRAGRTLAPPGSGLDSPMRHHTRRAYCRTEGDAAGHRARVPLPASESGTTRGSAWCRMRRHLWRRGGPGQRQTPATLWVAGRVPRRAVRSPMVPGSGRSACLSVPPEDSTAKDRGVDGQPDRA